MHRSAVQLTIVAGLLAAALWGATPLLGEGYFEIESRDGAWWFTEPDGQEFFSLGVNVVDAGPPVEKYDAARPCYAAWRYYANDDAWAEDSLRRLTQWNFNTIGGWSDDRLFQSGMPYTVVLHVGAEFGVPWNDLFAAEFVHDVDRAIERRVAPSREDGRLIGWFPDNELPWFADSLFIFHASQPVGSQTRGRLVQLLRESYANDFAAFEEDFAVAGGATSFDQFQKEGSLKLIAGGKSHDVIGRFTTLLAERYYSVVCNSIRKHDANHLILGDRYHGYCPDEVACAAGKHVDVISTNYDWPHGKDGYLPMFYLRRLNALTGKPVLVSEYYVAATDNGSGNPNTGGLFAVVDTQAQRADAARRRLQKFTDEPYIVGAHWFSYADEPPHGRSRDGEDYNFGLVDIANRPYKALTSVFQSQQLQTKKRHAGAARRSLLGVSTTAQIEASQLETGLSIELVNQAMQSQAHSTLPDTAGLADLVVGWTESCVYLTLSGNHYLNEEVYAVQPVPLSEGLDWRAAFTLEQSSAAANLLMLGDRSRLSTGDAEYFHWQRGVRFGATMALPARSLGREVLRPGDSIELHLTLCDQRDNRQSEWRTRVTLRNAAAPGPTSIRPGSDHQRHDLNKERQP